MSADPPRSQDKEAGTQGAEGLVNYTAQRVQTNLLPGLPISSGVLSQGQPNNFNMGSNGQDQHLSQSHSAAGLFQNLQQIVSTTENARESPHLLGQSAQLLAQPDNIYLLANTYPAECFRSNNQAQHPGAVVNGSQSETSSVGLPSTLSVPQQQQHQLSFITLLQPGQHRQPVHASHVPLLLQTSKMASSPGQVHIQIARQNAPSQQTPTQQSPAASSQMQPESQHIQSLSQQIQNQQMQPQGQHMQPQRQQVQPQGQQMQPHGQQIQPHGQQMQLQGQQIQPHGPQMQPQGQQIQPQGQQMQPQGQQMQPQGQQMQPQGQQMQPQGQQMQPQGQQMQPQGQQMQPQGQQMQPQGLQMQPQGQQMQPQSQQTQQILARLAMYGAASTYPSTCSSSKVSAPASFMAVSQAEQHMMGTSNQLHGVGLTAQSQGSVFTNLAGDASVMSTIGTSTQGQLRQIYHYHDQLAGQANHIQGRVAGIANHNQGQPTGQSNLNLGQQIAQVNYNQGHLTNQASHNQGQLTGQANHNQDQLIGQANHNQSQLTGQANHNQGQLTGQTTNNQGQLTGQANHNQGQLTGQANHNQGQLTGQVNHNQGQLTGQASHNQGQLAGLNNHNQGQLTGQANHNPTLTFTNLMSQTGTLVGQQSYTRASANVSHGGESQLAQILGLQHHGQKDQSVWYSVPRNIGNSEDDGDGISEEEIMLIQELSRCKNTVRCDQIRERLKERGLEPHEIEDMLKYYRDARLEDDNDYSEKRQASSVSSLLQILTSPDNYQQRFQARVPLTGSSQPQSSLPSSSAELTPSQVSCSLPVSQAVYRLPSSEFMSYSEADHKPAMSSATINVPSNMSCMGEQSSPDQKPTGFPVATSGLGQLSLSHPYSEPRSPSTSHQDHPQKVTLMNIEAGGGYSSSQAAGWQAHAQRQPVVSQADLRQVTLTNPAFPDQSTSLQFCRSLQSPGQSQLAHQLTVRHPRSAQLCTPIHHATVSASFIQSGLAGVAVSQPQLFLRQTVPEQQTGSTSVAASCTISQQDASLTPAARLAPASPTQASCLLPVPSSLRFQRMPTLNSLPTFVPISSLPASSLKTTHSNNLPASVDAHVLEPSDKNPSPHDVNLARLRVMHMQQSLDKEIRAKKGVVSPNSQYSASHANVQNPRIDLQNRLSFPPTASSISVPQGQRQPGQAFPAYQPKHQLPPRQPIPAILDPNLCSQTFSGGRPICSVAPFTSNNRMPVIGQQGQHLSLAPNIHSQTPCPVSSQHIGALLRTPGPLLHRPSAAPPISLGLSPPTSSTISQMNSVEGPALVNAQPNHSQASSMAQGHLTSFPGLRPDSGGCGNQPDEKYLATYGSKQRALTVNMLYQIRSPKDNSMILALWNGESFEDVKQSDVKALIQTGQFTLTETGLQPVMSDISKNQQLHQPATSATSDLDRLAGGCTSKFQAEFMQSLSQNYLSPRDDGCIQEPNSSQSSAQDQVMAPCDRSGVQGAHNQATYVKPLPPGGALRNGEQQQQDDGDDDVFKKPFSENEDYFRVCQHCGYTSKNFKRCDGCKRVFQGEVKIHSLKKQSGPAISVPSGPAVSLPIAAPGPPLLKQTVASKTEETKPVSSTPQPKTAKAGKAARGQGPRVRAGRTKGGGLGSKAGAKGNKGSSESQTESDASDSSSTDTKKASSSSEGSGKKRPPRPKSKNPSPRKRTKKTNEPVTVTISSDEDEPSSTSNHVASHAPSPAGSESPLFPSTPAEPVNAFGRFRRVLMEDEEGQSKLSRKIQQQLIKPLVDRFDDEREMEEDDDEDDDEEPPTHEIEIRSVRIGSMRTQPDGPLIINMQGVCFKVRSERTEEAFECEILAQDVEQVKFCCNQIQPVIFLFLTPECGQVLRQVCHMEPGDAEYFDPASTDLKQKMVVIIIECFNYMPQEMLRETLSLWADLNHVDDDSFLEELTEHRANDLLIQSAPPVLTADMERDVVKFKKRYLQETEKSSSVASVPSSPSDSMDNEPDSTSGSPPRPKNFTGTCVRLLLYPPPPARGIPISTEDLFCLTEGEFLNDVIIDFYLQYLYQEKLSEENRRRTHIFSSFFYKRLTQRDRHGDKTEDEVKKSLPERRHARVKKWTKTVDLFSKDFVIVPINEHSHWYLAVICFPGLASAEIVPFAPNSVSKQTDMEDHSTSESMTTLGRHLDPKLCLDSEDCKYVLGLKQPCILMFDSLAGPSRNPNIKMLKDYLQCEWNAKRSETRNISKIVRGSTPRVPQQSNYSDCGVYLLQYVESFFQDPIADFQVPVKGLQGWFPEEVVHTKRREIHELIMHLHRQYQQGRGDQRVLDIQFQSTPRDPSFNQSQDVRPEDIAGFSREDDSSNSSFSGEPSRSDLSSLPLSADSGLLAGQTPSAVGRLPAGARNQTAQNHGQNLSDRPRTRTNH